MTPRVVFDCMVFLQAAARGAGPAGAGLDAVRQGKLQLFVSPEILAEIRDVLLRPKTRLKFPALTPEAVDLFLRDVEAIATLSGTVAATYSLARDPKDAPYLNLAIAVGASYLVSRDQDLLDLMADETFLGDHPNLVILDPAALLGRLGS